MSNENPLKVMKTSIQLPEILTANTYFWKPSGSASGRRTNEVKRLSEVENFFKHLSFEIEKTGCKLIARKDEVEVVFTYEESCNNVYKHLAVYQGDKKKDIRLLKKLL